MRIITTSVEEFLEDLGHDIDQVLQKCVRVSVSKRPIDNIDRRRAVTFDVVIQASAVVDMGPDGQYLLEVGEDCGRDFTDATGEYAGSDRAAELKDRIRQFCDIHGLTVRPGVIEV